MWWICVELGKLGFLLNMFSQAPFEESGTCASRMAAKMRKHWGGQQGEVATTASIILRRGKLKGSLIIVIHRLQLPSEFI